ncbi:peptide MFS transporter [Agromyces silvae]|uniref:peptide MFS transporter n=1 Tax=Agromyces silvae TaxID=3388266 RepID=UPI00280B7125|nr:oligopeptide:H+ symporter [Agromyces protaetiae]
MALSTTTRPSLKLLPRGAGGIAFTEFWERFSFYGLQAVLFYYLIFSLADGGLELDAAVAASLVGGYAGLVYFAQIGGGWLGDRVLAPQWAVLAGGIGIFAGHIVLAAVPELTGLTIGLGLIVLGTGALKTNITSLFGFTLDEHGTASRDSSFSYFYVAINLGAVVGPLLTGWLQSDGGFHWAFGAAAVGMGAALAIYVANLRKLPERARVIANQLSRSQGFVALAGGTTLVVLIAAAIWAQWITFENLSLVTSGLAAAAAVAYFVAIFGSRLHSRVEKRRVAGFLPLFIAACVYYAIAYQAYTAVSTLIATELDLQIFGWAFPIGWVLAFAAFLPILAGPVIAEIWKRQGDRQATAPVKFATALAIVGLVYLLLTGTAQVIGSWQIPLLLFMLLIGVAFISDVFLGPVALSLATEVGPSRAPGQLVALNFLSLAIGSAFSGVLGGLYLELGASLYFAAIGGVACACAAALLAGRRPIVHLLRTAR